MAATRKTTCGTRSSCRRGTAPPARRLPRAARRPGTARREHRPSCPSRASPPPGPPRREGARPGTGVLPVAAALHRPSTRGQTRLPRFRMRGAARAPPQPPLGRKDGGRDTGPGAAPTARPRGHPRGPVCSFGVEEDEIGGEPSPARPSPLGFLSRQSLSAKKAPYCCVIDTAGPLAASLSPLSPRRLLKGCARSIIPNCN